MKSLKSRKLSFSFFPGLKELNKAWQIIAYFSEEVTKSSSSRTSSSNFSQNIREVAHSIAECRQAYLKATLLHK